MGERRMTDNLFICRRTIESSEYGTKYYVYETIAPYVPQEWQPIETLDAMPIEEQKKTVLLAWKNTLKPYTSNGIHTPDWLFDVRPYCTEGTHGAKSWHGQATHWKPLDAPKMKEGV